MLFSFVGSSIYRVNGMGGFNYIKKKRLMDLALCLLLAGEERSTIEGKEDVQLREQVYKVLEEGRKTLQYSKVLS